VITIEVKLVDVKGGRTFADKCSERWVWCNTASSEQYTNRGPSSFKVDGYNILYEHLRYGYAASEQKPVGSDITIPYKHNVAKQIVIADIWLCDFSVFIRVTADRWHWFKQHLCGAILRTDGWLLFTWSLWLSQISYICQASVTVFGKMYMMCYHFLYRFLVF